MKIKIKRIDKTLPLPKYQTDGAVGFDLFCRQKTHIGPQTIGLIPANVIIETPPGYMLVIALRSSTPRKKGLLIPHGLGIIDQDYCGPSDEILIQVFNFTDQEVIIEPGERIAQGIFVKVENAKSGIGWQETDQINHKTRGGFGSTDSE